MIQVAMITGQSNPRSCALSPVQRRFLERLASPAVRVHPTNFPFLLDTPAHRPNSLALASMRNALQFVSSRLHPLEARRRASVAELIDRASHTVFVAGSCGLELLDSVKLPVTSVDRMSVFAYGPVAFGAPDCRLFTVRGRRDPLSRWFFPRVDSIVDCGHLEYLKSEEVLDLCRAFVVSAEHRTRRPGAG